MSTRWSIAEWRWAMPTRPPRLTRCAPIARRWKSSRASAASRSRLEAIHDETAEHPLGLVGGHGAVRGISLELPVTHVRSKRHMIRQRVVGAPRPGHRIDPAFRSIRGNSGDLALSWGDTEESLRILVVGPSHFRS